MSNRKLLAGDIINKYGELHVVLESDLGTYELEALSFQVVKKVYTSTDCVPLTLTRSHRVYKLIGLANQLEAYAKTLRELAGTVEDHPEEAYDVQAVPAVVEESDSSLPF
jgi:hypothetical protein